MPSVGPVRRLVILVSGELTCAAALLGVRHTFLGPLTESPDPADALHAGLWLLAVGAAGWLLVVTVAFLAVEVVPEVPARLHATVASVTPRMVRVVVTRAVAVSLLASTAALPAVPAAHAAVRTGREPVSTTTSTAVHAPDPAPGPGEVTTPTDAVIGATTSSPPGTVRVEPGDNLWTIAAARVRVLTGTEPTDAQIAPYWGRVVEENRDRLRSGDPDLIFPGEVVVLP